MSCLPVETQREKAAGKGIDHRRFIMKDKAEVEKKKEKKTEEIMEDILEEIEVEDLTVDGICGVY